MHTYTVHTYIQRDRQTWIHTDIHAYIHTYIHTYRQTDREKDRHTYVHVSLSQSCDLNREIHIQIDK